MAKRGKPVGAVAGLSTTVAEAEVLEEAAQRRLKAAETMAKANAILRDTRREEEDPEPEPERQPDPLPPEPLPDPEEPDLREPLGPGERAPNRLEAIVESLKDTGKVTIYRVVGATKSKLGVYSINEYPEIAETLAHEYGGGTFFFRFCDEYGYVRGTDTQTFDQAAYKGRKSDAGDSGAGMQALLLAQMERAEKREEEARREAAEMRAENQRMMLSLMERLARPAEAAPVRPANEFAEMLKLFQSMMPKPESPMSQMKGMLEMAAMFKEEVAQVEPEHPAVAAIDRVFKHISPFIGALAQKAARGASSVAPAPVAGVKTPVTPVGSTTGPSPLALGGPSGSPASQGKPASAAPAPGSPGAASPGGAPSPGVATSPEADAVPDEIRSFAPMLLQQIEVGKSADDVADAIISLTDEAELETLDNIVSYPGFVGWLLSAEPKLAPHQAWLVRLGVSIKEALDEMAEPEEPAAPAAPAVPEAPAGGVSAALTVSPPPSNGHAPIPEEVRPA